MTLNKQQREALRMKFGGFCAYCGCPLPEKGWHADHVEPIHRKLQYSYDQRRYVATGDMYSPQNDRLDNFFPACAPCNIDKHAVPLEAWREYLQDRIVNGLRRNSSTFRHAERFGRVIITPGPLVFWFEKYQAGPAEKEEK